MKTDRKGRIRLQKGDYRVGNFVLHKENGFIKVMATSGIVSWRISTDTTVGMLVEEAMNEKKDNWLAIYAAMNFSQLCTVPSPDFFRKHSELINAQVEAHPEYYGKEPPTDDKDFDDEIIKEEQQIQDFLDKCEDDQ